MKIAIPSYKRASTIRIKTLQYLLECGVNMADVYIFVANDKEFESYKYLVADLGVNLIAGVPTLCAQRNFITNYFKEGEEVACLDDDVEGIYLKIDDKKTVKELNFAGMCKEGFLLCNKHNTKLWGIGAVLNPFFLKFDHSIDLKYIVGCFWGYIVDKTLVISLEDKEDFERTILAYHKYGAVVRLNKYAPKTNYYKEAGGMQETRTAQRVTDSANILLQRWPQYCVLNTGKKSNHTEIRLRHDKTFNPKQGKVSDFFDIQW
jgi:hypothetical protein